MTTPGESVLNQYMEAQRIAEVARRRRERNAYWRNARQNVLVSLGLVGAVLLTWAIGALVGMITVTPDHRAGWEAIRIGAMWFTACWLAASIHIWDLTKRWRSDSNALVDTSVTDGMVIALASSVFVLLAVGFDQVVAGIPKLLP